MIVTRLMGIGCLAFALYWLQFYLRRHEALTLAQLVVLLCAGALLVFQERPARPRAVWFRGPRPTSAAGWLTVGVALALAAVVLVAIDADSHSASDTLHRIVPTYSLIAAVVAKFIAGHTAGAEPRDHVVA